VQIIHRNNSGSRTKPETRRPSMISSKRYWRIISRKTRRFLKFFCYSLLHSTAVLWNMTGFGREIKRVINYFECHLGDKATFPSEISRILRCHGILNTNARFSPCHARMARDNSVKSLGTGKVIFILTPEHWQPHQLPLAPVFHKFSFLACKTKTFLDRHRHSLNDFIRV
jgi:hypothetical protein